MQIAIPADLAVLHHSGSWIKLLTNSCSPILPSGQKPSTSASTLASRLTHASTYVLLQSKRLVPALPVYSTTSVCLFPKLPYQRVRLSCSKPLAQVTSVCPFERLRRSVETGCPEQWEHRKTCPNPYLLCRTGSVGGPMSITEILEMRRVDGPARSRSAINSARSSSCRGWSGFVFAARHEGLSSQGLADESLLVAPRETQLISDDDVERK
jgi:hypothetical protein